MKSLARFIPCLFLFLQACSTSTVEDAPQNPPAKPDHFSESLRKYAEGHQAFRDCCLKEHEEEFMRLAKEGQTPRTLLITCSDSRIVPDLINNLRGGQMFVIRNAGNFVPTYDAKIDWDGIAATIQYGIDVLGITDIIVCGHTHCGAIEALYKDPAKLPPLIANWLRFGDDAKKFVLLNAGDLQDQDKYTMTGKASVLFQLSHLASFPFLKDKIEHDRVFLHGWYYDIATADIYYFDPATFSFRPLIDVLKNTQ